MRPVSELIVPRRFCGPPDSGNGGWTAGALAALDDADSPDNRCDSWPPIEVSLRQPPPLDTPLDVTEADGVLSAAFGGATIATAHRVDRALVDGEQVRPQPGTFYGGWITDEVVGPFKGKPGTRGW